MQCLLRQFPYCLLFVNEQLSFSRKKTISEEGVAIVFEFWQDFFGIACAGSQYDQVQAAPLFL